MPEKNDIENIRLLYSENAKVAAAFWEWRHKVMTRFFAAVAACVVMASWFYQHSELKAWVVLPFALAALFSVLSDMMDRVNTRVLGECYRLGMMMEEKLSEDAGIFKGITEMHQSRTSYHRVLRVMYIGCAVIFSAGALLAILFIR